MSPKIEDAFASMFQNLQEKTGRSLEEWVATARSSGIEKHKELVAYLQNEHGLTYGYANSIALHARQTAPVTQDDLVEAQYAGEKAALRPLYDALLAVVRSFGADVEVSPKKANVSLRRKKQFAILQPSVKTRLDVGLVLKGVEPAGRLEAAGSFNAMVTHRVRLSSLDEVDPELVGWLRRAYDQA